MENRGTDAHQTSTYTSNLRVMNSCFSRYKVEFHRGTSLETLKQSTYQNWRIHGKIEKEIGLRDEPHQPQKEENKDHHEKSPWSLLKRDEHTHWNTSTLRLGNNVLVCSRNVKPYNLWSAIICWMGWTSITRCIIFI